jgi:predicted DNA-binding protein (MmcQ/YjbR family)
MNIEELRDYCLSLKGATEDFPFGEFNLVLKVQGKMFGLIPLDNPEPQITLKCDPERAIQLREEYEAITTAYHFNKKHWNTVKIDPSISTSLLFELINHSYELVVASLTNKLKEELRLSVSK